jgi:hypothetical protein
MHVQLRDRDRDRDLKDKIVRYLLIDIERITIDVSAPNRMRIRIQGASARQCEYIWDCLAPDLPGIELTVEGGGFGSIPDRARWPLLGGALGMPNVSPFAWGPWAEASALGAAVERSVFWELAASGVRRA